MLQGRGGRAVQQIGFRAYRWRCFVSDARLTREDCTVQRRHTFSLLFGAFALPFLPRVAASQVSQARGWAPDRPITMATGYGPGGSTDIAARLLADRMAAALGSGV